MKTNSWPANAVNGPTMTKPLDLQKQCGVTFTSPAEQRKWEAENPNITLRPTSDSGWKQHKDRAREKANKMAARGGYQDIEHMRYEKKKAHA